MICPEMSTGVRKASNECDDLIRVKCIGKECALWIKQDKEGHCGLIQQPFVNQGIILTNPKEKE